MKRYTKEPDASYKRKPHRATNVFDTKRNQREAFVVASLVALAVALPVSVQAGFFSFFTDMFNTSRVSYANEPPLATYNSQTIPLLQAARNVDPNPAKGGGDITVVSGSALLPDAGPLGTLANIEDQPTSDQISIYVVREADSLSQIAQMFNVSVNTIIWSNDIKRGDHITPGQTLVILPITGVQYTVKKDDTLKSIAKKYEGDAEEIIQYNGLPEDGSLSVGQMITIPGGEIPAPKISPTYATRVRGTGGPNYSGYYLRPAAGVRTQGLHGYNGIDIGAPYGTPIVAAASGDVIISRSGGWNGGYGNYVVIKHPNGTQTLYAHNSRNIVYAGQSVVQGQVIAYMGSTGRSTGNHLHFEVRGAKNPF